MLMKLVLGYSVASLLHDVSVPGPGTESIAVWKVHVHGRAKL